MFSKFLMAAAAIISTHLVAHAQDTTTIEQYTKHLLETYGSDTKITGAIIYGIEKPAQAGEKLFGEFYPPPPSNNNNLNEDELPATLLSVALLESTGCSPIIYTATAEGTTQNRWCQVNKLIQGVTFEIRRDMYTFSSGLWSFSGFSGYFDCQNTADRNAMPNPQVRSKCQ